MYLPDLPQSTATPLSIVTTFLEGNVYKSVDYRNAGVSELAQWVKGACHQAR